VFQKLDMMKKTDLDKLEGFTRCLIMQRETTKPAQVKRPLLLVPKGMKNEGESSYERN
jgi:hypothetical protein